ncbi:MAG: helix-turn-helix domain-containing protein [Candidatus Odinarchaeota archaeon]
MLERLINEGENDKVEFKETFRYDVKTNQKNKARKKDVTKAIAGFLNHQGGVLLIGVDDDCQIKGLNRDLMTYGGENDIKNRDNLLKDINFTCRKHLGTRVIGLLTITYETVDEEEIIMIEVSPSDEPLFDDEDIFYLRNGPETITLVGQNLANYILKRFGRSEPSSLDVIPQQTMGLDERIGILKRIIKNLMIEYYFGGKVGKSFNPKINTIIYKIAKVINNFDNSTLEDYIRGNSTKPDYHKLARIFFGVSFESFTESIENHQIEKNQIKRTKLVLVGDIAYIMNFWKESTKKSKKNYLNNIYDVLILRTIDLKMANIISEISHEDFLKAIDILVQLRLIDLTYHSEKNNLDNIEWKIINEVKLISFYQSKSIFYLLDLEEISELPVNRKGYCIRCKKPLNLDPQSPFCYACYRSWARYGNWDYQERYCHSCGELAATSRSKPLCNDCYFGE